MTCEEGYGGLAGGRHWANLGGNGGAGLGGKVEHFLKVEWLEAKIVDVLEADFWWLISADFEAACGVGSSNGSANSDNSSMVE